MENVSIPNLNAARKNTGGCSRWVDISIRALIQLAPARGEGKQLANGVLAVASLLSHEGVGP